jgi:Flp pilus assembly protein TadB
VVTLRSILCRLLGGHQVSRVPVWRDGKARLVCGYGCGWESAGIAVPQGRTRRAPVVASTLAPGGRMTAGRTDVLEAVLKGALDAVEPERGLDESVTRIAALSRLLADAVAAHALARQDEATGDGVINALAALATDILMPRALARMAEARRRAPLTAPAGAGVH